MPAADRSVFGAQARFPRDRVHVEGRSADYVRISNADGERTFHFCPDCGATVFYPHSQRPRTRSPCRWARVADPNFPAAPVSVWEDRMHQWVGLPNRDRG